MKGFDAGTRQEQFRSETVPYEATWSDTQQMSDVERSDPKNGRRGADGNGREDPHWTKGLKRLYDSVVEEPLPDSFKDLLSRLEDSKK